MALNKVNYVDNETIITAQNLNDIQDNIIANANANPYIGYVSDIFAVAENCICKYNINTLNSPYSAGLTGSSDGICIITLVGDYASYICYPTSHSIVCMATKTPNGYQGWYNLDLEKNYPIGSIYMTVSGESPAYLFGGTWERIDDRFLLGAGTSYTVGSIGGTSTNTISVHNLPSDTTIFTSTANENGGNHWSTGIWASHGQGWGNIPMSQITNIIPNSQPLNNMPPYYAVYIWRRVS